MWRYFGESLDGEQHPPETAVVGPLSIRSRTYGQGQDTVRPLPRHVEGHLLRRTENPEGSSENGSRRNSQDLKAAFEKHKEEIEGHVERLQQVFELMGKRAQGKTCDAIEGIISEGEDIIETFKGTPAIDAGLISSARAVEHYEMIRYGTLTRWATVLGMKDAGKLLDLRLGEETMTDKALTDRCDISRPSTIGRI